MHLCTTKIYLESYRVLSPFSPEHFSIHTLSNLFTLFHHTKKENSSSSQDFHKILTIFDLIPYLTEHYHQKKKIYLACLTFKLDCASSLSIDSKLIFIQEKKKRFIHLWYKHVMK